MNKENIKRANELVKEVKELEALIPYIDNCLSEEIDGFNEIKIVLTSSAYQTKRNSTICSSINAGNCYNGKR